jgi:hypothetical protein
VAEYRIDLGDPERGGQGRKKIIQDDQPFLVPAHAILDNNEPFLKNGKAAGGLVAKLSYSTFQHFGDSGHPVRE